MLAAVRGISLEPRTVLLLDVFPCLSARSTKDQRNDYRRPMRKDRVSKLKRRNPSDLSLLDSVSYLINGLTDRVLAPPGSPADVTSWWEQDPAESSSQRRA
jgi:hypothetical protein